MSRKLILYGLIAIFTYCCAPSGYQPLEVDLQNGKTMWDSLTFAELNKGYHTYVAKCGGCHKLYKPSEITKTKWNTVLPDMKQEAKLSNQEYDLVKKYVYSKMNNNL